MADKIPDYAFNPLRRCLDSIFITNRLLHLSVNGGWPTLDPLELLRVAYPCGFAFGKGGAAFR
jgi:hypothetical protein